MIRFPPFRLDPASHQLWRDEEIVPLRPRAFDVLRYLAEHPGILIGKRELFEAVWPDTHVSDTVLKVCMAEIRRALGDDAKAPTFIETMPRRGYRFIAAVRHEPPDARHEPPPSPLASRPPLVGRERELETLARCAEAAAHGIRQLVFVTGEPGIGKTALVEAFLRGVETGDWKLNGEPASSLQPPASLLIGRGQCMEHGAVVEPFLPLLDALGRLGRQPAGQRIVNLLRRQAPAWLAHLPEITTAAERARLGRDAMGTSADRMRRVMVEVLEALARDGLLVLVLEDLHWSDAATIEILSLLAQRDDPAQLLIVATYRPVEVILRDHPLRALRPFLLTRHRCLEVALSPLSPAAIAAYLGVRFPPDLPEAFAVWLHGRTDGNPLFMVNVLDQLIADGLLRDVDGGWSVLPGFESAGVPESLRELIERHIATLDADAQRLLEAAAAAGMEFGPAVVGAALAEDAGVVADRCHDLARVGHFLRARAPERYAFTHSLYRAVLYERIAPPRRALLHARIGEHLESAAADAERHAAELAEHFERSGQSARAARHLEAVAQTAAHRSAYRDAIAAAEHALALLPAIGDGAERLGLELRLRIAQGESLVAVHGNSPLAVHEPFARALEIAQQLRDPPRLLPAIWGLWAHYIESGQYDVARQLATQSLRLAASSGDVEALAKAHRAMAGTHLWRGEFMDARAHSERSLALVDARQHAATVSVYGPDAGGVHRAFIEWVLGYPDTAERCIQEAVALARELSPAYSVASALSASASIALHRGDYAGAARRADELLDFATARGILKFVPSALISAGYARAQLGAVAEGFAQAEAGFAQWRAAAGPHLLTFIAPPMAELYALAGRAAAAGALIDEALASIAASGEHVGQVELHRVRAELLRRAGARGAAEAELQGALAVARAQAAKMLELRVATALARLWRDAGRAADARALVGGLYAWFTEGFDTADLRAAQALIGST